jgi:predicted Rossmann-fold nucleotide-binding protein
MKVLVCGGRDFDDQALLYDVLDEIESNEGPITLVIQGGASGADELALDWAKYRGKDCLTVAADWKTHGKAAGPIRNSKMLSYNPDLVVAFPGGAGTADMVKKAIAAGGKVEQIT